jgi:outer membrane receptor protein involved in Fe transport
MLMRHLWTSLVILALAAGLAPEGRGQIQLASRGPRFLSAKTVEGKRTDASKAAVLQRRVSVALSGSPVEAALKEIARQADLELIFSRTALPRDRRVTLNATDITVAGALTVVLLDSGLDVLLLPSGMMGVVPRAEPVQVGSIVGRVTDSKSGAAIAGATVIVEGTSRNAATATDGHYRLGDMAPGSYTLRARYIGYAPGTTAVTVSTDQESTADFALERSVQRLDEVVTTGTVVPTELKALPTPINVITAEDIQRLGIQRVDQLFRGTIPGASAFDQGEADHYSEITVRGRNTFDFSSIKTYVDGVEVADPLFIATIDPNSIERVEVIRGPQGSTVHGSGARGGVMQVFTKRGVLGTSRPTLEGKVSVGVVQGQYAEGDAALHQEHSLGLSGRREEFSYNVGAMYLSTGAWKPRYATRNYSVSGGLWVRQGPVTLEASAREYQKRWNVSHDPILRQFAAVVPPLGSYSYELDEVRQQTFGLTLGVAAGPRWQHTLTFGRDGQVFEDYNERPRLSTPADTFFRVNHSSVGKTSVRYNTTVEMPLGARIVSTLTAGIEYAVLSQDAFNVPEALLNEGSIAPQSAPSIVRLKFGNSGYFTQLKFGLADQLFLTGGLRADRNPESFGDEYDVAWAPRIGVAYVREFGDVSLKLRAAYGKSINALAPGYKQEIRGPNYLYRPSLTIGPEEQAGGDGGVELYWGQRASVSLTYYDQTAVNLIDAVVVDPDPEMTIYEWQNVGRIKNKGWEAEGTVNVGAVALTGMFSKVSSKVRALSPTYLGDLQVGDEMLGVAHTVAGATVTYRLPRGAAALSVTHLGSWVELDWLALYRSDLYYGTEPFRGSFRDYWIDYPAVTKLNLMLSHDLGARLNSFVQVDNLLDDIGPEGTNVVVSKGRLSLVGLRFKY